MLSVFSLCISLLGIWFCSGVLHDLSLLWTKSCLAVCSRGWVGRLWFSILWISYRMSFLFCGSILVLFCHLGFYVPYASFSHYDFGWGWCWVIRIRFMVLSRIFCAYFSSALVGIHVSAP
jgi:hypothetical protein